MVQKYLKPVKKFASKKLIMEKLDLSQKDFDLLISLTGIHPHVPKNKEKYDLSEDFYFKISDYEKIKNSHVLKTIKYNNKRMKKKERLVDNRLYERAEQIQPREFKYVELVRERFKTFPEAVDALGDTLTALSLGIRLSLDDSLKDVIANFQSFCVAHGLLQNAFLSTKGIYYEVKIENMRIIWQNPYPNLSLKEIIEIKVDEPKPFEWSEPNFLHFASESEEDEEEDFKPINNPDKLDVSLLSFSLPLQKVHLELVMHKLMQLYKDESSKKREDFKGKKFFIEIENLNEDVSFVIKSLSGEVVQDESFDFCIGEKIENVLNDKVYVHPQFVFNTLNLGHKKVQYEDYKLGKTIPKHHSPFILTNFIDPNTLSTLSKSKRNKLQDIIDGFKDVHYKGD